MEYIDGTTLAQAVRNGPVPLGGLVQVATEVCAALAAAHAIGIIHRDLKPDNVLVTGEGHAKVLDFGIAKLAPDLHHGLSPRTQTGALLGTPYYMAPEQITGSGAIDARTDVYAAGVLLYEAICGRRPFDGETLYDLMRAHLELTPPSLRTLRSDVPIGLEFVVMTAMAKRPEDRFQSVTAMANAIQGAAADLPEEAWRPVSARGALSPMIARAATPAQESAPRPTVATAAPARRRWLWISAAAVSVLAIAAIGVAIQHGGGRVTTSASIASTSTPGKPSTPAPTTTPRATGPSSATTTPSPAATPVSTGPSSATTSTPSPAVTPVDPSPTPMPTATPNAAVAAASAPHSTPSPVAAVAVSSPPHPAHQPATPNPTPSTARAPAAKNPASTPGTSYIDREEAAKAGVIIKGNVVIGPGVTIAGGDGGANTKRGPTRHPIDYNPKRFDATAYAPKALALARAVYADVGLVRFDMVNVYPDGHADLTLTDDDARYLFRSPSHSARPTDVPANLHVDIACYVEVTVGPKAIEVRVRDLDPLDPNCRSPIRRLPTCTLAAVWAQAKAAGAKPNTIAKVAFLDDGKWFFDNEYDGDGVVESFVDRCP